MRGWMWPSTCANSWKISSWCSGAMPIPESATSNTSRSAPARRARTATNPRSVNLIALATRLRSTCDSFCSSPVIAGRSGSTSNRSATCGGTSGWRIRRSALSAPSTWNRLAWTTARPASVRARSSRSLTYAVSVSATSWMIRTCLSCSQVSSPSSRSIRNCEIVDSECSGVRSSWPISESRRVRSSTARRWYSARSSSSACSAITPRLVSVSSSVSSTIRWSRSAMSRCRRRISWLGSLASWPASWNRIAPIRPASTLAARRGRRLDISTRVPAVLDSIAKLSISRRAPGRPTPPTPPVPVAVARRSPDRIAATSAIPGPRSITTIDSASRWSSSPNVTEPPAA